MNCACASRKHFSLPFAHRFTDHLGRVCNMEEDHSHSEEEEGGHGEHDPGAGDEDPGAGPLKVDIEQIIPIVDSILEQDDKVESEVSSKQS